MSSNDVLAIILISVVAIFFIGFISSVVFHIKFWRLISFIQRNDAGLYQELGEPRLFKIYKSGTASLAFKVFALTNNDKCNPAIAQQSASLNKLFNIGVSCFGVLFVLGIAMFYLAEK